MNKQVLFSLPVGLMVLVTACSQPSSADAEAALCSDLGTLKTSLETLGSLDSNATVSELANAQKQVEASMKSVRESAAQVQESRLNELEDAYTEYEKTINGISGNDTLGEAAATVEGATVTLLGTRNSIYSGLNCQ